MRIYKYFPLNKNSIDSLSNDYLWFSKPRFFNDPFDCNMEVIKYYNDFVNSILKLGEDTQDIIINNTKEFGICCFSETNDNIHMWAHYADSHKGICVEYEASGFDDYFSNMLKAKCHLHKVDYRSLPIDLNQPIEWEKNGETTLYPIDLILTCPKLLDQLFEKLLLQKHKLTWGNENELRLLLGGLARKNKLVHETDKGYKVPLERKMINAIIFGSNICPDLKNTLKEIFKLEVQYRDARLNHKEWKLSII